MLTWGCQHFGRIRGSTTPIYSDLPHFTPIYRYKRDTTKFVNVEIGALTIAQPRGRVVSLFCFLLVGWNYPSLAKPKNPIAGCGL